MKPASLTGVLNEKTLVYIFSKTQLFEVPLRISAKACGNIGEIMSKKHAEEKSKKKNRDCQKKIFVQHLVSHSPRNIFSSKKIVTEICSQTHKKNIKNAHRSAQN